MKRITRDELKGYLDNHENITLVEALPNMYWRKSHIPGALQIDFTEVNEKAASLLPNKGDKIVEYCASTECQNSTKAARALESLGYSDIHEYVEGKQDWDEAGYPLISEQRN